ncbi:MAG: VWA domain-containing protein [Candidatus Omnitrophica bacterium]|nr:VWA domain-containing protein [Candidatus Omnitrophota bacterium]
MRFAEPLYFYGLILLLPFVGLVVMLARRRRKKVAEFVEKELSNVVAANFSPERYTWKNVFLVLTFLFSILALTRPQWGFEWQEVKRRGVDILIAIDTSKSMLTEDLKPNRLERTKLAVKDLLRKLKGDRVGLIAFAGDAFLVCPLTADYAGFQLSLDDLSIDTVPRGGTNLGKAIETALGGYTDIPAQYKAVVILTDGENWEGDPLVWARKAAEKKIRVYTIGIGTREGELIRVPDDKGEMGFLKDKEGNFIKSRLNEPLLKEIAAATSGAYARASGAEFGLDYLYDNELSRMEKRDIESDMEKRYHDRYQIFAGLALLCFLAQALILTRKS